MAKTKVDVGYQSTGASIAPSHNAADAVIEIARDAVHGHLNTLARLSEVFIPTSVGRILRHDMPPYGRLNLDFWNQCGLWNALKETTGLSSRSVQVTDEGETYVLEFVVPGYESSELDVLINSRGVTVQSKKPEPGRNTRTLLGAWTSFEEINPKGATATLDKGILKVMVPKSEENKASRVEIS